MAVPICPPRGVVEDWSAWLGGENEQDEKAIRRNTQTGRLCGETEFCARVETMLSRALTPRKAGRKKKPAEVQRDGLFNG